MTITISQSFVIEVLPLFIRVGSYELFWDRSELVICKGLDTLVHRPGLFWRRWR
jgi:hypothetical protein